MPAFDDREFLGVIRRTLPRVCARRAEDAGLDHDQRLMLRVLAAGPWQVQWYSTAVTDRMGHLGRVKVWLPGEGVEIAADGPYAWADENDVLEEAAGVVARIVEAATKHPVGRVAWYMRSCIEGVGFEVYANISRILYRPELLDPDAQYPIPCATESDADECARQLFRRWAEYILRRYERIDERTHGEHA